MIFLLSFISLILAVPNAFGGEDFKKHWLKLYHLEMNSQKSFYFTDSPWDASKEIKEAEIKFSQTDFMDTDGHPQCLFPARYALYKRYNDRKFKDSECPSFDKWMKDLSPNGVSLIFAGNYPDNPGSIFGHTFLKVHTDSTSRLQSQGSRHSPILDYALNYAASVDDEIGLLYAFKGLLGGYQGGLLMDPYYVKVNEYSEGEGRDIWEYKLNFSREDSSFLLAHFWELKYQSSFDYYFLDDNCSFLVLGLIDATRPEWKLITSDPYYVIPIETVKDLKAIKGSITETTYRPSIRKRAEKSYGQLRPGQKNSVLKIIDSSKSPTEENDPEVLNTVALNFLSKRSYHDGNLDKKDQHLLDQTFGKLSTLDTSSLHQNNERPGDPSDSHDVKQVGFGFGHQGSGYGQIYFRPGLHDLTDYQQGYLDYSELVVTDINLRFQEEKITLHQVNIFELGLLRPMTLREKALSWRTRWSYQNQSQIFCTGCKATYGEGMAGVSKYLGEKILGYALAGAFLNIESLTFNNSALGAMAELGMIYSPSNDLRFILGLNSKLNTMSTQYGRTLHQINLQGTYHFTKDIDLNLRSLSGLMLSGSNYLKSDLFLSLDLHF